MDNVLENISNKQFAFLCLNLLETSAALDNISINILTDADECKRLFQCSGKFSILSEIPLNCTDEELDLHCYDYSGRQRYYKERIIIPGRAFVVTNHWYGPNKSMPDNRTPFLRWVINKI